MDSKSTTTHHETVIMQTELHWIIFLFPAIVTCGSIVFIFKQNFLFILNFAAIALICYFLGDAFIRYVTTTFTLTNERLIIRQGLIFVQTWDIPLTQIESTRLIQTLSGRLLDYGDVTIDKTGGNQNFLNSVAQPTKFRNLLMNALDKLHEE